MKTSRSQNTEHWAYFRLLSLLAILFFAFQWGYQNARGTIIERIVIDNTTVKSSAALIDWLSPNEKVFSRGHQIISSSARLSVLNGCEGTEAWFLLIAAILTFKSKWRNKVVGLVAGTLFVYVVNQIRIVGLFFALQHDRALFAALHGYIGPTLIVALICLFFIGWIRWSVRSQAKVS